MPIKNSLKIYVPEGYYHVYNRGIDKSVIFKDKQDYGVFLSYLKTYLLPQNKTAIFLRLYKNSLGDNEKNDLITILKLKNYSQEIDLIAYCLMPNHYHLLVKQVKETSLEYFMRSFMTRYTKYFNARHKRRGPLFEGRYKAVLVESDEQLIHLSRYIHRNPIAHLSPAAFHVKGFNRYDALCKQPTSYPVFVGGTNQTWVKPNIILDNFAPAGANSYRTFVEEIDSNTDEKNITKIYDVAIDYDYDEKDTL